MKREKWKSLKVWQHGKRWSVHVRVTWLEEQKKAPLKFSSFSVMSGRYYKPLPLNCVEQTGSVIDSGLG